MNPSLLHRGIKASDLARWEWCNEESFLRCHGVERHATTYDRAGSAVHKLVVREPRELWEQDFSEKLHTQRPFCREVEGVIVYGGIDAIDPAGLREGVVRFIECKTRGERSVPPFLIGPALFQLEIYLWIFQPLVKKIGYSLADTHYVDFVHRESMTILARYACKTDCEKIGEKIASVLSLIKKNENIHGAKESEPWKCTHCAPEFKSRCRFWQEEHGQAGI